MTRWARACFAATALAVLTALVIQVAVAATEEGGHFTSVGGRVFNVFCFFTIQSNILVGVASTLLALRLKRSSQAFAVLRLTGLVAITITAVVYHTVLSDLRELTDWALTADVLLHTLVPLLAILGWLLFGPRSLTSPRIAVLTLIFPICWLAFTLIRGPIVDFYPYPFLDVNDLGYPAVLANSALVALLFATVAAGAAALDQRITRGRTTTPDPTPQPE